MLGVLMRAHTTQGWDKIWVWLHTNDTEVRAVPWKSSFPGDGYVSVGAFKHTLSTSSSLALRLLRTHLSFRRQREINGFLIFTSANSFSLPLSLSPPSSSPSLSLPPPLLWPRYCSSLVLALTHWVFLSAPSAPGLQVAPTLLPHCFMSVTLLEIRSVYDGKYVHTCVLSR